MVNDVHVGIASDQVIDYGGQPVIFGYGKFTVYINTENPCPEDNVKLVTFKARIDIGSQFTEALVAFASYGYSNGVYYLRDITEYQHMYTAGDYIRTFNAELDMDMGEFLAAIIYLPNYETDGPNADASCVFAGITIDHDPGYICSSPNGAPSSINENDLNEDQFGNGFLFEGFGDVYSTGGLPQPNYYGTEISEDCSTWTNDIEVPGWYNGRGYIRFDDVYSNPYRVKLDVNTPWLQEFHDVIAYENSSNEDDTLIFRNPADLSEVYSIRINSVAVFGGYKVIDSFRECWYRESPDVDQRWVAMDGSDTIVPGPIGDSRGKDPTKPFKTITKAINDLSAGGLIHVKEGYYGNETGIASISKNIMISPEDRNFQMNPCVVNVSDQSFTTTNYGNLSGSAGSGSPTQAVMFFLATKAVPSNGVIISVSALVDANNIASVVILRPLGSNSYQVLYNEPFDNQNAYPGVSSSTMNVIVQVGDIVGVVLDTGGYVYYSFQGTGYDKWNYGNITNEAGDTITQTLYNTDNEVSIQYTLLT